MRALFASLAFCCAMLSGVYLCVHDFPVLGGWVCILTLFATWGYERADK